MAAEQKHTDAEKGHKAEHKAEVRKEAKKAEAKAKPVSKKTAKAVKKKSSYRIARSAEAMKMAVVKSRLEKKKGKFKRPGYGKMAKVKNRWRRPKGIDSRQRQGFKCKPPMPNSGYTTPQSIRGAHPSGYFPVRVCNVADLAKVDSKTQAAVIASAVSKKKRAEIQKAASEKKIQVLNYTE